MGIASILTGWKVAAALVTIPAVAQSDASDPAGASSTAVADMVTGILSYSRWDSAPNQIRLCITGTAPMTARLTARTLSGGRALTVIRMAPSAVTEGNCHAVYIGQMAPPDRARLINRLGGSAILSLTDADPLCEYGAMFCLRSTAQGVGFELNIDAVARSRVRVDPRVLALGRRSRGAP